MTDTIYDHIPMQSSIEVEHICDFEIELSEDFPRFKTPRGTRMNASLKAGKVVGPKLKGDCIAGGDWMIMNDDGVANLDIRKTIRTDDGEYIYVTNLGKVVLPPEALQKYRNGEVVPWNEFYGRSNPVFETGSEKYAWLNSVVTIAVQEVGPTRVHYRVYAVK